MEDTIVLHRRPDGTVYVVAGYARAMQVTHGYEEVRSFYSAETHNLLTSREMSLEIAVTRSVSVDEIAEVWKNINQPKELPAPKGELPSG